MTKYFEDLDVGWEDTYGSRSVSKDEIVTFAEQFDPQPFHVDEEAADDSIFGGIIASGLHTLCLSVRMYTDAFLHDVALVVGRGLDEVRFHEPVYPGDSLSIHVKILDKENNESRPAWGNVRFELSTMNQHNDTVLSLRDPSIIERGHDSQGYD